MSRAILQLLLEPLLFRLLLQQVLDARRHRVERAGQLAELIAPPDRDPVGEVALADPLGPFEQVVDRSGDGAREAEAHDERDNLDHEEQRADHRDEHEQELAEVERPDLRQRTRR